MLRLPPRFRDIASEVLARILALAWIGGFILGVELALRRLSY